MGCGCVKSMNPVPVTVTVVLPRLEPLLGLTLSTWCGAKKKTSAIVSVYCCPLSETITGKAPLRLASGERHLRNEALTRVEAAPHQDGGVELGRASDGHKPRDCHGAIVDVEHSIIRVLLPVLCHLDGEPPVVTLRVRRDAGHVTGLYLKLGWSNKFHNRAHPAEAAAVVGAISQVPASDGDVGVAENRARRRAQGTEARVAVVSEVRRVVHEPREVLVVERQLKVVIDRALAVYVRRVATDHWRYGEPVCRRVDQVFDAPVTGRGAQCSHKRRVEILEHEQVVRVLLRVETDLQRNRGAAESDLAVGTLTRDRIQGRLVEGLCVEHCLALGVSIAAAVYRAIREVCSCDAGYCVSLDRTGARRDGGQARRSVVVESLRIGVILPVGRHAKVDWPCDAAAKAAPKARLGVGLERLELDKDLCGAKRGATTRLDAEEELSRKILELHCIPSVLLVVDRHLDWDERIYVGCRVEARNSALEIVAVRLVTEKVANHLALAELAAVGVTAPEVRTVDQDDGTSHLRAEVGIDKADVGDRKVRVVVCGRLRGVALEQAVAEELRIDYDVAKAALVIVAVLKVDARDEEARPAGDGAGARDNHGHRWWRVVGDVLPNVVEGARDTQVVHPVVVAPPVRARTQRKLPATPWSVAGDGDVFGRRAAVAPGVPVAAPATPAGVIDGETAGWRIVEVDASPGSDAQHIGAHLPQPDELAIVLDAQIVGSRHKRDEQAVKWCVGGDAVRGQPAGFLEQRRVGKRTVDD
eukprot:scaffold26940_cov117-Phaeocystis_antarctica.AAC.8